MVRSEDCAEPSFAARREASRLGIAIAAIIPMMATTISNSISEKPLSLNLVIWTTYKKRDGVSPIPFSIEVQSVLVTECSQGIARGTVSYRCYSGRPSHHTVFGDAEVAGT